MLILVGCGAIDPKMPAPISKPLTQKMKIRTPDMKEGLVSRSVTSEVSIKITKNLLGSRVVLVCLLPPGIYQCAPICK
jgi:hypothetical protein